MVNGGRFAVTFRRDGDVAVAVPSDFREQDWDLTERVVTAVRGALDGPTLQLPMKPVTGVEDTQPVSTWFLR